MVNLEWYRTFKSVYKNGNFSVAANELFISQPAVSQQIAMLEAHVGYKLFNRKSKGVEPTEYAKLLNNLIIEALDRLENVEQGFREKAFQSNKLVSVGISKHYFSSIGKHLIRQFDFIDFTFAENDELFVLVNEKKIDLAIVSKRYDTFDTIQLLLGKVKLVAVASTDIDLEAVRAEIEVANYGFVEKWLHKQKWYSDEAQISHIKFFWLHVFDKKRPSIIPNYIIPSESEMLATLVENTGVAIVWDINAKRYLASGQLQLVWDSSKMPTEELYLMARKNNTLNSILEELRVVLVSLL
ncbi:MAG: LysR family transcriptional regulator [Spirosomataceae bacterium]